MTPRWLYHVHDSGAENETVEDSDPHTMHGSYPCIVCGSLIILRRTHPDWKQRCFRVMLVKLAVAAFIALSVIVVTIATHHA